MAPAFSKEAILTGAVDYLCLVCENYFKNERDIAAHVAQPCHRENLKKTTFVKKYRADRVKQIKRWFFCELCNVLLHSEKRIELHIAESKHIENKSTQALERVGDLVIVSNNVAIHEDTWHGLIDSSCILCDVDFDDKEAHKFETNHVIKLIQSKIMDINNNIYRKTADSTFHCLTCNKMVAAITAHFDKTQHKELLQKCRDARKIVDDENSNKITLKSNNQQGEVVNNFENIAKDKDVNTTDILTNISHIQMNGININFESLTAVCKRCLTHLEFDFRIIESHIQEHKNEQKTEKLPKLSTPGNFEEYEKSKTSDSKTLFTSPVFLKQSESKNKKIVATKPTESAQKINIDGIKKKKNDDQEEQVDEKHKMFDNSNKSENMTHEDNNSEKHEETNDNNGNVKSKKSKGNEVVKDSNPKRCNLEKVLTRVFITKMTGITEEKKEQAGCVYVILNDSYCIHMFSFVLLRFIEPKRWKCLLCEVNLYIGDLNSHIKGEKHVRMLTDVPVVVHASEFIREICPGSFHCGFCNTVETSWLGMEDHLKSIAHKESKTAASWRLTEVAAELQKNVTECHNENDMFKNIRLNC